MHADARKLLWDAQHAAERIARFATGKTFTEYETDEYLRSAVERQFEIIGLGYVGLPLAVEFPKKFHTTGLDTKQSRITLVGADGIT